MKKARKVDYRTTKQTIINHRQYIHVCYVKLFARIDIGKYVLKDYG